MATTDSLLGDATSDMTSSVTSTTEMTTEFYEPFLNLWARNLTDIIMDQVVCFSLAVLGSVANFLIILVYAKQRFRESVAISMTTIAVWDLIKCLAAILQHFSGIIEPWNPAVAFSWRSISLVVCQYLACFSTYVTSVLAAYVAVERCLCVSQPLKVKWLLTRKVSLTACLVISVSVFGLFVIMFGIYNIVWVWDESLNATVAIYEQNAFLRANEGPLFMYYNMSAILWPVVAMIVITVCTVIIVHKLREGAKFRQRHGGAGDAGDSEKQHASLENTDKQQKAQLKQQKSQQQTEGQQQQQLSSRDRQVVKMLLVIIGLYVACLSPRIAMYMAKNIVYDFNFLMRQHYLFEFVLNWLFVADLVNGIVNFFIFYAMSSSFKATFKSMFSLSKNKQATTKQESA